MELRAERHPAGPIGTVGARRAVQSQGRNGRGRRPAGGPHGQRRPNVVPLLPDGAGGSGRCRRRATLRRVQLVLLLRRP